MMYNLVKFPSNINMKTTHRSAYVGKMLIWIAKIEG